MTVEKARLIITDFMRYMKVLGFVDDNVSEALSVATSTILKQEPKLVKKYLFGYKCPQCDNKLNTKYLNQQQFCENCGQHLQWDYL